MNKKTKQKSEKCGQFCSILPICILVSILTAVLVTLVFSIAFVRSFKLEAKTNYDVTDAFKSAIAANKKDDDGITVITSDAVIDFFTSDKTGFIYATEDDCDSCNAFGARLARATKSAEIADVYHYVHNPDDNGKVETSAREVTIGTDEAPVLIYVKEGRVYDRLDDANSESDLGTFLAKYK